MLSWRLLYTNPPSATKPTPTITPSPIPAFFPALIPPSDDAVVAPAVISLWLTSLASEGSGAGTSGVESGCGDGEEDVGGAGGEAAAGDFAGAPEGDGGSEICGESEDGDGESASG